MRHRRERFALYHGKGNARNPPKSSSTVKMIATSAVDFMTQGIKGHDAQTGPPGQLCTAPPVVYNAMQCQQHRGEVSAGLLKAKFSRNYIYYNIHVLLFDCSYAWKL